jgi:ABC-type phosphate transport system substrate-binding protein
MKKLTFLSILLFFATSISADVAVIVHPQNNNVMEKSYVKRLFLGKTKTFPDGSPANPINQKENNRATVEFNEKVIEKSSSQIKAYWSKLIFTGRGTPPEQVDSDAEVIRIVSNNLDAIGYIDAGNVNNSVKVVLKF